MVAGVFPEFICSSAFKWPVTCSPPPFLNCLPSSPFCLLLYMEKEKRVQALPLLLSWEARGEGQRLPEGAQGQSLGGAGWAPVCLTGRSWRVQELLAGREPCLAVLGAAGIGETSMRPKLWVPTVTSTPQGILGGDRVTTRASQRR